MLDIHKNIKTQLKKFIEHNKIPNIILYGDSGSGKKTILYDFISEIYTGIHNKKDYIMYINCAHNKGIKFIREELKFFAKINIQKNNIFNKSNVYNSNTITHTPTQTNINTNSFNSQYINNDNLYKKNPLIKSVILINADFLTTDAQSALRRSIELFSKNTRFFMVAKNRDSLLDPIISRFCNIYIPNPIIKGRVVNLHKINKYQFIETQTRKHNIIIKKMLLSLNKSNILKHSIDLYENGCSGIELLDYIMEKYSNIKSINNKKTDFYSDIDTATISKMILYCHKIKTEIRSERLFILFILNSYLMRHIISLENIDIM